MSFEGTYQILCKNGHQHYVDVYIYDKESWKCPVCGEKELWWHIIDHTNGEGKAVKLKIKKAKYCMCEKCGNSHLTEPITYHIPKERFKNHRRTK